MTSAITKHDAEMMPAGYAPLSATAVRAQVNLIQEVMQSVMQKGTHFDVIPGCGDKPALLKAGAEKLGLTFRLIPAFKVTRSELPNAHREYEIVCTLTTPAGEVVGEGVGCCSTMETKYRWRGGRRKCPACGREAIIQTKGGRNPGGFWCVPDKGGCNANFDKDDQTVTGQQLGRMENPDIADTYNTVLKMAKKRAHVDAILTATAASDIFTQDIEEATPEAAAAAKPAQRAGPEPRTVVSDPAPLDLIHKLHTLWLRRHGWRRVLEWYESQEQYTFNVPAKFEQPQTDDDLAAIQSWLTAEAGRFLSDAWDATAKANAERAARVKAQPGPRLHSGDENGDPEPALAGDAAE